MNSTNKKPLALEVAAIILVLLLVVAWGYFTHFGRGGESVPTTTVRPTPRPAVPLKVSNVNVTKCLPAPHEAIVEPGQAIGFVNKDDASHTISFDKTHTYIVKAQSKTTVKMNFWQSGKKSYSCDTRTDAGVINISVK